MGFVGHGKGAQTPSEGLASKARLYSVERRTPLTLYERHGAPLVVLCGADVISPGRITFLLAEVPAEALTVAGVKHLGDLGLDMRDQPLGYSSCFVIRPVVQLRRLLLAMC